MDVLDLVRYETKRAYAWLENLVADIPAGAIVLAATIALVLGTTGCYSDSTQPQPTAIRPASGQSDEFNGDSVPAAWTDLAPERHTVLDVGQSSAGRLTIVPNNGDMNAWFSDSQGPLLFQAVEGDFVAETAVVLGSASDMRTTPTLPGSFSGAGFVVRDPASSRGQERWVMYDIGFQDSAVAFEVKTTVPGSGDSAASESTLYLNNTRQGANAALLRVCRLGSQFRFFHRYEGDAAWTEEQVRLSGPDPTRVIASGSESTVSDGSTLVFDRPDMPQAVQVGLMVGVWAPDPGGTRGEFDYVRFGPATSSDDCTAELSGPEP
jgi:hypothetical protein